MSDLADEIRATFAADEPGAIEATYKSGSAIDPVPIIVRRKYGSLIGQTRQQYNAQVSTFLILVADVAEPKEGDTITIGSAIWTVRIGGDFELRGDDLLWVVEATKSEARRFAK